MLDYEPPKPTENSLTKGVRPLIKELFVDTISTPIPDAIETILDLLAPLCRESKWGKHLAARGSAVTRAVLGTPPGYYRHSDLFAYLRFQPETQNLSSKAQKIIDHVVEGPDLDILYLLDHQYQDSDVSDTLSRWINEQNKFSQTSKIRYTLKQAKLSEWNGEEDNRVYSQLIIDKLRGREWLQALRVDIGKEPDGRELYLDGRLSPLMTTTDLFSYAKLKKRPDNHWRFIVDKEDKDFITTQINRVPHLANRPHVEYKVAGRLLSQQIWWPHGESLLHFVLRQANPRHSANWDSDSPHWQFGSFPHGTEYFTDTRLLDHDRLAHLELSLPDIQTRFLIGLSSDTYGWLAYADSIGLLSHLNIIDHLDDVQAQNRLIEYAIGRNFSDLSDKSRIARALMGNMRILASEYLSREYLLRFPKAGYLPRSFGPLVLLSDMIESGILPYDTPYNLDTMLTLLEPKVLKK